MTTETTTERRQNREMEFAVREDGVTMHEFIFGGPCYHLNGNGLDNRRENLAAERRQSVGSK